MNFTKDTYATPAVEEQHAELSALSKLALSHFKTRLRRNQKTVDANQHLLTQTVSDQTLYNCTGELSIAFAIIYNQLSISSMNFDDPVAHLTFEGDGWGVGIGGGVAWFTGWFNISPTQLIGAEADYQVFNSGPGVGVDFQIDGVPVGSLIAAGIAVGSGIFAGSGTFNGSLG